MRGGRKIIRRERPCGDPIALGGGRLAGVVKCPDFPVIEDIGAQRAFLCCRGINSRNNDSRAGLCAYHIESEFVNNGGSVPVPLDLASGDRLPGERGRRRGRSCRGRVRTEQAGEPTGRYVVAVESSYMVVITCA